MSLALQVTRRAATPGEVQAALARLDHAPGMYFGVDAGIAGLHPMQATLLDCPALCLRVRGGGLAIDAPPAPGSLGRALLDHSALKAWAAALPRGGSPVAQLRTLLQVFEPLPEVLLLGALQFNAHRLASDTAAADEDLGVLFLAQRYWQRDAQGTWTRISLGLPGLADDNDAPPPAVQAVTAPAGPPPQDDYAPGGYAQMVSRALVHLRTQPLVSLTLSQSYRRHCSASAAAAFDRLRQANPAPVTFFLNDGSTTQLFGASPDLQLVVQGRSVQALPVCGTVARGTGPVGEAESFRELVNEEVDAASLAVCTDALRNDLAPLCEPGSLRLLERRRQMSLATVVHTVDRLEGRLRAGSDAWDPILATTAPVMLTGTPRPHALAAIEQLEASPRGWYGGLALRISADGNALVGTLLRAAAISNGVAEVRTGGDLLADSVPEREEQESRLKSLSLWRALGLQDSQSPSTQAAPSMLPPTAPALPVAVSLHDAGDPFPNAVRETLLGLGLHIDARAQIAVLLGAGPGGWCAQPAYAAPAVALGDAALRLLALHGVAIEAIAPAHGRLVHCTPTAQAPWPQASRFAAGRYASLALTPGTPLPSGWAVWAHDDDHQPVMLAHAQRRQVCLLVRPESLLSGPQALQALRAALAFCAAGGIAS